jgi:hypothetical protein
MNNTRMYNAALAGAAGGMLASRNNPSITASDYDTITDKAEAFATELDSLIPNIPCGADISFAVIVNLCYAAWVNRLYPSIVASDYAQIAGQIVAEYNSLITAIAGDYSKEAQVNGGAGSLGGIMFSRNKPSIIEADYNGLSAIANAFGKEAYAIKGSITPFPSVYCWQQICFTLWANRGYSSITLTDYATLVNQIVAIHTAVAAELV